MIREARERKGLTQSQVAIKANVSNSTISRIEDGKTRKPDRGRLRAIADALDLDVVKLLRTADQLTVHEKLALGQGLTVEDAILSDPRLDPDDRQVLIATYRRLASPRR